MDGTCLGAVAREGDVAREGGWSPAFDRGRAVGTRWGVGRCGAAAREGARRGAEAREGGRSWFGARLGAERTAPLFPPFDRCGAAAREGARRGAEAREGTAREGGPAREGVESRGRARFCDSARAGNDQPVTKRMLR